MFELRFQCFSAELGFLGAFDRLFWPALKIWPCGAFEQRHIIESLRVDERRFSGGSVLKYKALVSITVGSCANKEYLIVVRRHSYCHSL